MAFFASKDLEGRVDESSLIDDSYTKNILKEFVLEVGEVVCQIIEINFLENDIFPYAEIKCEGNIHAVDQLMFSNNNGSVYFKNKLIEIDSFRIVKILKKDNDTYIISLNGRISRGQTNV